jgi:hypothetical protein
VSKNVEEGLFLRAPEERAGRYRGWVRLSELRHVSHCCHGLSRNLTFPWLRGGRPFHLSKKTLYKQYGVTFHMKLACSMRVVRPAHSK